MNKSREVLSIAIAVMGLLVIWSPAPITASGIIQQSSPTPHKQPRFDPKQPPQGTIADTVKSQKNKYSSCLSTDVSLDALTESSTSKPTTVRQKLGQLKARCVKGKLRDARGKQLYLYSMVGCWGNPPADYQEILAKQEADIKQLERKYTVIRVSCRSTTDPRLIQ